MNLFYLFKYILLVLYKFFVNFEDLMYILKLYNGGFFNIYKKYKNFWLNKIMILKKINKINQKKIQYLYL